MALLPMGHPTDLTFEPYSNHIEHPPEEAQESMFGETPRFSAGDPYEGAYEIAPEVGDEPTGEYADEVPELISYQGGSEPIAVHPEAQAVEPESHSAEIAAAPEPTADLAHEEAFAEAPRSGATLSANDFASLEDRVLRAVALVRTERQARAEAEANVREMEARLHSFEIQLQQIEAQTPVLERLLQEVESLRIEREQVRQRVERLLGQLDALEL